MTVGHFKEMNSLQFDLVFSNDDEADLFIFCEFEETA